MKARKQDLETIKSLSVHLRGCMDFLYQAELEQEMALPEPIRVLMVESTISLQKARLVLIEHGIETADMSRGGSRGN